MKAKHVAIAFSLANLVLIRLWSEFSEPAASAYFNKDALAVTDGVVYFLGLLFLATLILGAHAFVRWARSRVLTTLSYWAFLVALLVPLNGVRQEVISKLPIYGWLYRLGHLGILVVLALAFLGVGYFTLRWPRRVATMAATVLLILFPLVPMAVGQTVWAMFRHQSTEGRPLPELAGFLPGARTGNRVIWIVFDGLDYRTAFVNRPASLRMPEFDRLARQSLQAQHAYPPATSTILSMPAYISGQMLDKVRPLHRSELLLFPKGKQQGVPWGASPNLFSKARAVGANGALVGWYHPYCRVLASSLATCSAPAEGRESLAESATFSLGRLLNTVPFMPLLDFWSGVDRREHIGLHQKAMEQATAASIHPDIRLALVHLPVPHLPGIYDRAREAFSPDREGSYLDNLALSDRALGELRRAMEQAGVWEQSAIVITADHSFKPSFWAWLRDPTNRGVGLGMERVPFFLKLPGQDRPETYSEEFNTVVTADLVLELLKGTITKPEDSVRWLQANRIVSPPVQIP